MALVVEDGTGTNPLANTYAALKDLVAFASARGETIPTSTTTGETLATVTDNGVDTLLNPGVSNVVITDSSTTPITLVLGTNYTLADNVVTFGAVGAFTQPFVAAYTFAQSQPCSVLLLKAMDYLEDLNYKGFRFKQFQALKWPRYDVIIDGWPLLLNQIPAQLIYAQCALAIEYQTVELLPTGQPWDHGSVMSDAISGAVTESYADNARVIYKAAVEKATRFIRDIVRDNGMVATRV